MRGGIPCLRGPPMLIYRTMEVAADGRPVVGDLSNQLGVRPSDPTNPTRHGDVTAAAPTDLVAPTEGLSAAPDGPNNLYPFLRKKGQKPGYAVWELDTDYLPTGLQFVPDSPTHGVLAPAVPTPLAAFQHLLATTRPLWRPVQLTAATPSPSEPRT